MNLKIEMFLFKSKPLQKEIISKTCELLQNLTLKYTYHYAFNFQNRNE